MRTVSAARLMRNCNREREKEEMDKQGEQNLKNFSDKKCSNLTYLVQQILL